VSDTDGRSDSAALAIYGKNVEMTRIPIFIGLALFAVAAMAEAGPVVVTMNGSITGTYDNTGALDGSGVTSGSTFVATFSFDDESVPYWAYSDATTDWWYHLIGPLTLVIDGTHSFTSDPAEARVINDDPNFADRIDISPEIGLSSATVTFPFAFNPNDYLLRLTLEDSTQTLFSDGALPGASFFNLPLSTFSQHELFIRTDLDRDAGELWIITGELTSMSAQAVPEPPSVRLLGFGLLAVGYLTLRRRRRPIGDCWQAVGSHSLFRLTGES
jgi:MYXO-CTERM domain-containing protein